MHEQQNLRSVALNYYRPKCYSLALCEASGDGDQSKHHSWYGDRQTDRQTDGRTDRQTDRQRMTETEREWDRDRDRDRYSDRDRQSDRQSQRQRDRERDRQRQKQRQRDRETETERDRDRQIEAERERDADRQIDIECKDCHKLSVYGWPESAASPVGKDLIINYHKSPWQGLSVVLMTAGVTAPAD